MMMSYCKKIGQPAEYAENGAEAVEVYTRKPGRFRVIFMGLCNATNPSDLALLDSTQIRACL